MLFLSSIARSLVLGSCVSALACAVGCGGVNTGTSTRGNSGSASEGDSNEDKTQASSDDNSTPGPDGQPSTSTPPNTPVNPSGVPAGSFGAGTDLLAIADVNVRSGEGTNFDVLATVPAGTRVKVQTTSGAGGWVNVVYEGKVGFSSKSLLSLAKYSAARGKLMGDRALVLWDGKPSRDLCLKGVDDTAESSGAFPANPGWLPRRPSAVDWQDYVAANPQELLARGYVRENLDLNKLPKGALIGWRPGQCGYHAQYGHLEIVADDNSSKACSDYCGAVKKDCGAALVYIPIELTN